MRHKESRASYERAEHYNGASTNLLDVCNFSDGSSLDQHKLEDHRNTPSGYEGLIYDRPRAMGKVATNSRSNGAIAVQLELVSLSSSSYFFLGVRRGGRIVPVVVLQFAWIGPNMMLLTHFAQPLSIFVSLVQRQHPPVLVHAKIAIGGVTIRIEVDGGRHAVPLCDTLFARLSQKGGHGILVVFYPLENLSVLFAELLLIFRAHGQDLGICLSHRERPEFGVKGLHLISQVHVLD